MVTSASAPIPPPPTRQHPQGPALLEGLQLPQRVVQVRGHLGEGVRVGPLPRLDQRELPLERPPGEEEAGTDGQEPVVHRPVYSRLPSTGAPAQAAHTSPAITCGTPEGTISTVTEPSPGDVPAGAYSSSRRGLRPPFRPRPRRGA